jgi:hypothetical protein
MQFQHGYSATQRRGYSAGVPFFDLLTQKLKDAGFPVDTASNLLNAGDTLGKLKGQIVAEICKQKGKKPEDVTELEITEYLSNMPTQKVADAVAKATEAKLGTIATAIVAAAVIGGTFYYLGRGRK